MFGFIDVNETPRLPFHSQPLYEAETHKGERERLYSCSIESWSKSHEAGSLTHQFSDLLVFTAHVMPASMSSVRWWGKERVLEETDDAFRIQVTTIHLPVFPPKHMLMQ